MQHSNPGPNYPRRQNQEDYMQYDGANNWSYEQNYPQNPGRRYNRPNYPENYMQHGRRNNRHFEQNNYNPAPYGRGYRPPQQNYLQNPAPYDRGHNRPHQQNNSWGYGSSGRRNNDKNDDIYISKCLSTILRHTAEKLHLKFDSEGYLYVKDLLVLDRFHGVTTDDVLRIVRENNKQRFSVKIEEGTENLMIRANQGHSIKFENLDVGLKPIDDPEDYPIVLHGTYYNYWEFIKKEGLKRMSRVHIHFAAGLPGENRVISGMRSSSEIIIYLNLKKAIEDGLKFFLSANNVILSSGDEHGIIAPKYFDKVVDARLGSLVSFISDGPVCQKKKEIPIGMSPVEDTDKNERTKKKKKDDKKNKPKHSLEKKSSDSHASKSHKRDNVTLKEESDLDKKKKTEPEIDKGLSAPDHWDSTEEPECPSEDVNEEGPSPKEIGPQEQLNLCPSEKDEPKSKNENESKKSKKKKANKDKTSSEDVKPSIENKMDAKSEGQKEPEKLKDKKKSAKKATEETRDSSKENPLENVESSYENKMDAASEVQKEQEKKKEKKPTKKATEETSDSSEGYPLDLRKEKIGKQIFRNKSKSLKGNYNAKLTTMIFIIIEEDEPDEELMAQLREQKLIGINVLKKESDITHFLITTVDNVFIFDVGTMKKYLKKSLEDIHCTKVMFNSSLVSELYKQMGISMYKTPIADIKILAEKHHKKKFMQFSELIGETSGKIPPPEHDIRYEKIAKQSCGKAKTVMKNLAQVAKMLPFFEIYKSSMDETMKAAIFENYDKDFEEETRAKLTRIYERKVSELF